MRGSTKVGVGLVLVALVIGSIGVFRPLPLSMGYVGFVFLLGGTVVGLVGIFANSSVGRGKE